MIVKVEKERRVIIGVSAVIHLRTPPNWHPDCRQSVPEFQ
jgi:hypothetical protein